MKSYPVISDRKIKLAIVGCGRISKNHFDSIEKHKKDIELVSICDDDQSVLTHHEKKYYNGNIKEKFIQDNYAYSKKNILRGMHYQLKFPQGKLIRCLKGEILDVAVDLRRGSKTFCKSFKIVLSDKNCKSIFIPAGFAHGFCGIDKENFVLYGCNKYRSKNDEIGILWNDKKLNIKWNIKKPIVSKKDKLNISLNEFLNKKLIKN